MADGPVPSLQPGNALTTSPPLEPRYGQLTVVEIAILRMYTDVFFLPWNAALRGMRVKHSGGMTTFEEDAGALPRWATCIAILCAAILKLSHASRSEDKTVYRGVYEGAGRELPESFYTPGVENGGHPGGAEPAVMSVTPDKWAAYEYSGGWDCLGPGWNPRRHPSTRMRAAPPMAIKPIGQPGWSQCAIGSYM